MPEIVRHQQTGLLVPRGEVFALADAIDHLLSNRLLTEAMGAAGRMVALREFAEGRMVDRFLELYQRLLGPVASSPATLSALSPNSSP